MNHTSETCPVWETVHKYMNRTARQFHYCFGCFRRKRIHPELNSVVGSKVIRFRSNKLIRVIHINNFTSRNGDLLNRYQYSEYIEMKAHFRSPSVSESDYTFTAWNKPLKTCSACKTSLKNPLNEAVWIPCSPKGMQQGTVNTDFKPQVSCETRTENQNDLKVSAVSSIEEFVEVFVREILQDTLVNLFPERDSRNSCNNSWSKEKCVSSKFQEPIWVPEMCEQSEKCFVNEVGASENKFHIKTTAGKDLQENFKTSVVNSGSPHEQESSFCSPARDKEPPSTNCASACVENHAYHNDSYVDNEEVTIQNDWKDERNATICNHGSKISKPILLFLHGVGCSADVWTNLLYHFAESGYEVVAPDMLGHGYSSTPDNASSYTFNSLLQDALEVFDMFVGEAKCVVIGHAFGCSLAAAIARHRHQEVSQLVLISGGGPTPLAPRRADFRPPMISPWLQMCLKPLLVCGLKRDFLYVPCGKHIETADSANSGVPSYVLQHIARGQDWPEGDTIFHRRIFAPTLLVHGMKDPYVTLVQECEMERTIPRSSLEVIPNAGHFAMLETPGKLCHMIHSFIDWWNL